MHTFNTKNMAAGQKGGGETARKRQQNTHTIYTYTTSTKTLTKKTKKELHVNIVNNNKHKETILLKNQFKKYQKRRSKKRIKDWTLERRKRKKSKIFTLSLSVFNSLLSPHSLYLSFKIQVHTTHTPHTHYTHTTHHTTTYSSLYERRIVPRWHNRNQNFEKFSLCVGFTDCTTSLPCPLN